MKYKGILMAKRMTDSEKWKKQWFQDLKPDYKLAWIYILDNCDPAGCWNINWSLLEFQIGKKIDKQACLNSLSKNIILIESNTKAFVIDFIDFQYHCTVSNLNPENKAHLGVIRIIEKYNLKDIIEGANKGLVSPLEGTQVQDKVQDKVQKNINREHIIFKDGKLNIPNDVKEDFCSSFSRGLLERELPKMEKWLKFNKPKKDYKRFVFNWLNRSQTTQELGRKPEKKSSLAIAMEKGQA